MISIGVGNGIPVTVAPYSNISNLTASWRAVGGCWELSARLTGNDLAARVPSWLGATVHHDSWDWFGRIVTIDLTVGRAKRRWDLLERYANRVVTVIGTASIETWQENEEGIERYGNWELVLDGDAGINGTQADDWSDRTLTKRSNSIPFGLGLNKFPAETHVVDITAIGLLPLTARIKNNITAGSDRVGIDISGLADQKISTVITDLCDTWSDDLLTAQAVSENATTVAEDEMQGANTWALLEELTSWASETGYRIDSDASGNTRYYAVTSSADEPDYDIYANSVRARGGGGLLLAGQCRPGWYRDLSSGVSMYGHEIRVKDGETMPEITWQEIDPDPFLDVAPVPIE